MTSKSIERRLAIQNEVVDRHGLTVEAAMRTLPPRPDDWPEAERIRLNAGQLSKFMGQLHEEWDCHGCMSCGRLQMFPLAASILQVHHILGGPYKSDEREALCLLCIECHQNVAGNFAKVLWLKWKQDPEWCDWVRLALLWRRRIAAEPEAPDDGEFWLPGFEPSARMNRAAQESLPLGRSNLNEPGLEVRHG